MATKFPRLYIYDGRQKNNNSYRKKKVSLQFLQEQRASYKCFGFICFLKIFTIHFLHLFFCKPKLFTFCIDFSTDANSNNDIGKLSVTGSFDREVESSIRLPFRMCDTKDFCGNRYMDVKVTDVNDNPHGPGYQYILVYNYKGETCEI